MGINIRGHLLVSRAHCQARFVDDQWVLVGVKGVVPQLTSSDETSRQMYPLTRSKGTLCVVLLPRSRISRQQ